MDELDVLLQVSDVGRTFGRNHILRGVTFTARRGEIVGIVGENGAGKTTLLRIIAGLLSPSRGWVELHGQLGYCPQEPQLHTGLTVAQNIEWFRAAYRLEHVRQAEVLIDRLGFRQHLNVLVSVLSGGTRQKLNLMLALMHDPEVLLLDEPYQGFDWETYMRFWDIAEEFRRTGRIIVIISHLVYERRRLDRLLRLREGLLIPEVAA